MAVDRLLCPESSLLGQSTPRPYWRFAPAGFWLRYTGVSGILFHRCDRIFDREIAPCLAWRRPDTIGRTCPAGLPSSGSGGLSQPDIFPLQTPIGRPETVCRNGVSCLFPQQVQAGTRPLMHLIIDCQLGSAVDNMSLYQDRRATNRPPSHQYLSMREETTPFYAELP